MNALLAWEALRRGRDQGCRWMNWREATEFKRELGGERVEVACRLGGGVVWALPNAAVVAWRRARRRMGTIARSVEAAQGRRSIMSQMPDGAALVRTAARVDHPGRVPGGSHVPAGSRPGGLPGLLQGPAETA